MVPIYLISLQVQKTSRSPIPESFLINNNKNICGQSNSTKTCLCIWALQITMDTRSWCMNASFNKHDVESVTDNTNISVQRNAYRS